MTVLHQHKLTFNSYNAYLRSTLEKNDLKYLNISFFDHFIPIPRKNLQFEAKIKKKDLFFYLASKFHQNLNDPPKNGPFIFFWKFHFFIFQVWPFWSEKITNLRLPEHILGGYYYNTYIT